MNSGMKHRLAGCVGAALALMALPAAAANYALIMTIGNYADPSASLPGIDLDAKMARAIARKMGVPEANVVEVKDQVLTKAGIGQQLKTLNDRVNPGDNVMLYYSGHGGQRNSGEGDGKCSEGLISQDMDMFADKDLTANLNMIASKAGQLVMLNDSCFSGGAARFKSAPRSGNTDRVPKNWSSKLSTPTEGRQCGDPINKTFRNMIPSATKQGANMLYIAAAADNEVANATSLGSAATLAWFNCLNAASDTDNSGMLSGEEVRVCAQRYLDDNRHNHHITLVGNQALPVSFAGYAGSSLASSNTNQQINPARGLEDLRAAASPAIKVEMRTSKPSMRIGQDELALTVRSSESGYLSIFQVGSDGKTFDLLYPNDIDSNNYVNAGETIALPRPSWRVKAGGPAGVSRLMAIVSTTPVASPAAASGKFIDTMPRLGNSAFHGSNATLGAIKVLFAVATGANENGYGNGRVSGRYGASEIISIQEY